MPTTAPCSRRSRAMTRRCVASRGSSARSRATATSSATTCSRPSERTRGLQDPPEELVSYLQLIGRAGDVAEEHELTFALPDRRPAPRRADARSRAWAAATCGALAVLAGEIGQLIELLDGAGDHRHRRADRAGSGRPRSATAYDPWGRRAAPAPARPQPRRGDGASRRTPPARSHARGALVAPARPTARFTARCGRRSGRASTCARCSCSRC